jgi:hypothetical protein
MDERLNHLPNRWLNEPEGYFGRVREGIGPGVAAKKDAMAKRAEALFALR